MAEISIQVLGPPGVVRCIGGETASQVRLMADIEIVWGDDDTTTPITALNGDNTPIYIAQASGAGTVIDRTIKKWIVYILKSGSSLLLRPAQEIMLLDDDFGVLVQIELHTISQWLIGAVTPPEDTPLPGDPPPTFTTDTFQHGDAEVDMIDGDDVSVVRVYYPLPFENGKIGRIVVTSRSTDLVTGVDEGTQGRSSFVAFMARRDEAAGTPAETGFLSWLAVAVDGFEVPAVIGNGFTGGFEIDFPSEGFTGGAEGGEFESQGFTGGFEGGEFESQGFTGGFSG